MRLDHLLSKEQLAPAGVSRRQVKAGRVLLVARGWNVDMGLHVKGSKLVRLLGAGNVSGLDGGGVHAVGS